MLLSCCVMPRALDTPEPKDVVTGKEHMKLRDAANLDVVAVA